MLRLRKSVELVKHRRAQLMQSGKRQLHLGLDARDLREPKTGRLPRRVAHQGRLSDAGLTSNDEYRALAASHIPEEPVQRFALTGPAPKRLPARGVHRPLSVNAKGSH